MKKSEENFLALLSHSLFGKTINLTDIDWNDVFRKAKTHAVVGLLYEAITLLPENSRPEKSIILKIYGYVAHIERQNQMVNSCVTELFNAYEQHHFRPILLKGAGVACNYAKPMWRTSGDIDIYVQATIEQINQWALSCGIEMDKYYQEIQKHASFYYKGIHIEPHFEIARLYSRSLNRRLQQIFEEGFSVEESLKMILNNETITLLPPTIGLLHLLVHFATHLLGGGVGLRQYCDILMYMHKHSAQINNKLLTQWLHDLKLSVLGNAFATCSSDLGLPSDQIPYQWTRNDKDAAILLRLLLDAGNFGHNYGSVGFENRFSRMRSTRLLLIRTSKLYHLFPSYMISTYLGKIRSAFFVWFRTRWF